MGDKINSRGTLEERFNSLLIKGDTTQECWVWQGTLNPFGYPRINRPGARHSVSASVVSYELYKGLMLKGKRPLHICKNKICVNPEHLWLSNSSEQYTEVS